MRTALLFILLVILLPVSIAVQDLLPPLPPMQERNFFTAGALLFWCLGPAAASSALLCARHGAGSGNGAASDPVGTGRTRFVRADYLLSGLDGRSSDAERVNPWNALGISPRLEAPW